MVPSEFSYYQNSESKLLKNDLSVKSAYKFVKLPFETLMAEIKTAFAEMFEFECQDKLIIFSIFGNSRHFEV